MYFFDLIDKIKLLMQNGEEFICSYSGEDSDFARLNQGKIRQAGHVKQNYITFELIQGSKHISSSFNVSGLMDNDLDNFKHTLDRLRQTILTIPKDPYFYYSDSDQESHESRNSQLPPSEQTVNTILHHAEGLDLVGIFAQGKICRAFANSFGQRNWFESENFNFDWSCYLEKDKAVKNYYAGFDWQENLLTEKLEDCREQLSLLKIPAISLTPGKYRSILSPSAIQELMSLLSWGGFGIKSHRSFQTPLIKMIKEQQTLDPRFSIIEDNRNALGPKFTPTGFIKPDKIKLINEGKYCETLVGPRSAKEFNMPINAGSEFPESLQIENGTLENKRKLSALDQGILINNLWYCNYSDRNNCRITGMTRFACFWVENGTIKAPINVMRFDDSLYNIFGKNLVDLTYEREFIFDSNTYNQRSTDSSLLPGALINNFNLTL